MRILRQIALAALMAMPAMGASAAVIDFDNASLGTHSNYIEDGFVFDKLRVVRAYCEGAPKNCGSENQFVNSTLTRVGGGLFAVSGMWISLVTQTPITFVTDRGSLALGVGSVFGGNTIEAQKGYVLDLSTESIFRNINFLRIVDVTLGTTGTGVFKGNLRFDNITVEPISVAAAVAPVPLPAAGGLLMAGMGGLALLRRRRRAA